VDEGHDTDDDAHETRQEGEDHECSGGIHVGCRDQRLTGVVRVQEWLTLACSDKLPILVNHLDCAWQMIILIWKACLDAYAVTRIMTLLCQNHQFKCNCSLMDKE
jgi:hypothetical protein